MASRIPTGPIRAAPYDAIPYTLGESSAPASEEALFAALKPLELGDYDRRAVAHLALEETPIVAAICAWLTRMEELHRG